MNKLFEQLLQERGISKRFLEPKYEDLADPMELPDMGEVVERLILAKEKRQKVLIYGDYDVDGVTATAIMRWTLELMGITGVETMLPDRFMDGYGMSERLVKRAKNDGIELVVTVDCGSNNAEIIEELAKMGVETIVTDHHEILNGLPEKVVAVINPKRDDFRKKVLKRQAEIIENSNGMQKDISGLSELSGAGIAFMVAKALADSGKIVRGQEKWLLDLAMIGTICDSMVVTGDNRIICKYGMLVLNKTRRVGLAELMRVAGVKKVTTEVIGFQIGPRLNAAGRMETAELSLKLILTRSRAEAAKIAGELDMLNAKRRKQQQLAVREVEESGDLNMPVIVAKGKWHEGIVGIVAGRLTERYRRPSFVLTEVENGADGDNKSINNKENKNESRVILKGSGRSFGDFNLALALSECKNVIIGGGGHAAACGLKLEADRFEEFKETVNRYYKSLSLCNQERFLEVHEDVTTESVGDINLELIEDMRKMEPFGEGNPEPVFLFSKMFVLDASKMGAEGQHLRLLLRDKDGKTIKLVAFYALNTWLNLQSGVEVNVWASLMENEWNGMRSVEGRILRLEIY